jgi:hypothetical protein
LAARRLALYADECSLVLKEKGYLGKSQSLDAQVAEVMSLLPKEKVAVVAAEEQVRSEAKPSEPLHD